MSNPLNTSHRQNVLATRGIADWLINDEPERYRSFDVHDWATFGRLMGLADVPPWLKGKVAQSGGVVVKRFGIGTDDPSPYARFDTAQYFGRPPAQPAYPGQGSSHYLYPSGDSAKRIDVHPFVRSYLGSDEPLYFCLEGCFKADAVASAGGLAVSSTSVTTWNGRDLDKLLPVLRRTPIVYVVPDSDYYSSDRYGGWFNPMVRWQAHAAAQWLMSRHVPTAIAVPWTGERFKMGVDDFLATGYSLADLTVVQAVPIGRPVVVQGTLHLTASEQRLLALLLSRYGLHGTFLVGEVAQSLSVHRRTVWRSYKRLVTLGILDVKPGGRYFDNGTWRSEPHSYVVLSGYNSYGEYLLQLPILHARSHGAAP